MNTKAGKRQPRSKEKLQGVMVYIPVDLNIRLSKYAEEWRVSKSSIVRDGVESRITHGVDNPYVKGFNAGLEEAVKIAKEIALMKMAYPSGTPVWKHLEDQIMQSKRNILEIKSVQADNSPWEQ